MLLLIRHGYAAPECKASDKELEERWSSLTETNENVIEIYAVGYLPPRGVTSN